MNDRERKDNELGIDLDMKGLTLDSDEAAKPQAQNRPVSHEDMARMIAKNMAMQDGGFDEPITPVRGVSWRWGVASSMCSTILNTRTCWRWYQGHCKRWCGYY